MNDIKMVSRSIISTVCYLCTERSKYSNCTVNPGQTRIFYKSGQTRRKCDPTRFQPWCARLYLCINYTFAGEMLLLFVIIKSLTCKIRIRVCRGLNSLWIAYHCRLPILSSLILPMHVRFDHSCITEGSDTNENRV